MEQNFKPVDDLIDEIDSMFEEHERLIKKIENAFVNLTRVTGGLKQTVVQGSSSLNSRDDILFKYIELTNDFGKSKEKIQKAYSEIVDKKVKIYVLKKIILKHKSAKEQNQIISATFSGISKQRINEIVRELEKKIKKQKN